VSKPEAEPEPDVDSELETDAEPTRERAEALEKKRETAALELEELRSERERLQKKVTRLKKKLPHAAAAPVVQPSTRQPPLRFARFLLALVAVPAGVVLGGIAGLFASTFVLIPAFPHGDWALPITAILLGLFGLMGGVLALIKIGV